MITNPTTREKVTIKEFFAQWKKGMEQITPLQQCNISLFGQMVSMIGVIWGIIFSIRLAYYWMMVILIGGFIVLAVQMLGVWQKKKVLEGIETMFNSSQEELQLNLEEVKNV